MLRTGQALLLPAKASFIWASLLVALLLNMLIHMLLDGQSPWVPDLLAITLVFWTVHQPRRVGILAAFMLGLLLDVHQGSLLGQHALAYAVLSYLAILIHRRLLWFKLSEQSLQVLPLFVAAHALQLLVRWVAGDGWPGWGVVAAPFLEALVWPIATYMLLLPQRRAHDPDENRPI
jgi:rod shape-determining protein MreD